MKLARLDQDDKSNIIDLNTYLNRGASPIWDEEAAHNVKPGMWSSYRPVLWVMVGVGLIVLCVLLGTGCDDGSEMWTAGYKAGRHQAQFEHGAIHATVSADSVDLIETREDIVYRLLDGPGAPMRKWMRNDDVLRPNEFDILHSRTSACIDEVLKRDFATWPMVPGAAKGSGGILDSGGPSDTTSR